MSRSALTAFDIMNADVMTVREDLTVSELAVFLTDQEISGAPVEDEHGKLVGVVSLTDIVRASSAGGERYVPDHDPSFYVRGWEERFEIEEIESFHFDNGGLLVRDIMTPSVFAVEATTPVREVARSMMDSHLHRILVVKDQSVVGIVSTSDMLALLAGSDAPDLDPTGQPGLGTVAFSGHCRLPFDAAVDRCRQALAAEGFGTLTEIDVRATLKKKLKVDREPYLILGACHPPSAHRALAAAPEVGVLLPCNVTVSVEEGQTVIRAMNPTLALGIFDRPELQEVASEVGAALQRVVRSVADA